MIENRINIPEHRIADMTIMMKALRRSPLHEEASHESIGNKGIVLEAKRERDQQTEDVKFNGKGTSKNTVERVGTFCLGYFRKTMQEIDDEFRRQEAAWKITEEYRKFWYKEVTEMFKQYDKKRIPMDRFPVNDSGLSDVYNCFLWWLKEEVTVSGDSQGA
ncbi:hypothetical protein M7I_7840 [Glarea lozoyensis 74030]|uniref:Uncharacterized protein n=1 Tax=Glarea lozoyensis (strain ATCC 74030 / MF5533) TaxID=1104152 RepID=H0EYE1_GLAL7|nr:hypothetical protein M7I_7840 [Glarea lozoyensis 74030]